MKLNGTLKWLAGILWVCLCCITLIYTQSGTVIDISIHDTYFLLPVFPLLIPLFILLTFLVFLIKSTLNGFRNRAENRITLLFLVLTSLLCTLFLLS